MKKVIITTVVATLTAVTVIAALYGGWRAYIHARESDPVEQARRTSAIMQERANAEMEVLQAKLRRIDLDAFELKHGMKARLEVEAEDARQSQGKGYAPECVETMTQDQLINETQEDRTAQFKRQGKCRAARLEKLYAQLHGKPGAKVKPEGQ